MEKYLIVDIGTSSLRVALVDEKLEILQVETNKRVADVTFDAEAEWDCIRMMIRKISQTEKEVSGIAVSSLLGWVIVDENGDALTPCFSYMHQEPAYCEAFCREYGDQEIYPVCGRRINPEWAAFKLKKMKTEQPEVYRKAKYLLSMKDFINMKLTGVGAVDHTSAGYTMLYDITKGEWSDSLIEKAGVDREKLPPLRRPYELLGEVKKDYLLEFGFADGVPVAMGSVDGSTAILGAGGTRKNMAVNVMGTTEVFFMVTEKWQTDKTAGLIVNPHVIPGLWLVGGPMGMFGGTVDWLLESVMGRSADILEMNERAARLEPGCGGLCVYPNLAGERTPFWNPGFRGTIVGAEHSHQAEHFFRGIMEASGYSVERIIELGRAAGISFDEVIAIGGGAKSPLWLQIKADITGKKYYSAEVPEATMMGSAMLLILALGKGVEALPAIHIKQEFQPDREAEAIYRKCYQGYMERHELVKKLYEM